MAGNRSFRQANQPGRKALHGDPRLCEARPQPVSEQTFIRSRKFRCVAGRHSQNRPTCYWLILN